MPDAMPPKVQELIDRSEILDCLTRCARGMDRHDAVLIASAYHADAIDDHGAFTGLRDEFVDFVNGSDGEPGVHEKLFADHMHYLSNQSVEIDGDTAHVETYYLMVAQYVGSDRCGLWTGRYIDRLERRDGAWKIAVRRVVMGDCTGELDGGASAGAEALALFTSKTWDKSDISYDRPLMVPEGRLRKAAV